MKEKEIKKNNRKQQHTDENQYNEESSHVHFDIHNTWHTLDTTLHHNEL